MSAVHLEHERRAACKHFSATRTTRIAKDVTCGQCRRTNVFANTSTVQSVRERFPERPSPTAIAIEKIREDEREKIARWLRAEVADGTSIGVIATAIQQGMHVRTDERGEERDG